MKTNNGVLVEFMMGLGIIVSAIILVGVGIGLVKLIARFYSYIALLFVPVMWAMVVICGLIIVWVIGNIALSNNQKD